MSRDRADRVAAWATGVGIGLVALMTTWLVGNRLAELIWEPPLGPILALCLAILVGAITAAVSGRRLSRGPRHHPGSRRPLGVGKRPQSDPE
jgi:hypothetical protein